MAGATTRRRCNCRCREVPQADRGERACSSETEPSKSFPGGTGQATFPRSRHPRQAAARSGGHGSTGAARSHAQRRWARAWRGRRGAHLAGREHGGTLGQGRWELLLAGRQSPLRIQSSRRSTPSLARAPATVLRTCRMISAMVSLHRGDTHTIHDAGYSGCTGRTTPARAAAHQGGWCNGANDAPRAASTPARCPWRPGTRCSARTWR